MNSTEGEKLPSKFRPQWRSTWHVFFFTAYSLRLPPSTSPYPPPPSAMVEGPGSKLSKRDNEQSFPWQRHPSYLKFVPPAVVVTAAAAAAPATAPARSVGLPAVHPT